MSSVPAPNYYIFFKATVKPAKGLADGAQWRSVSTHQANQYRVQNYPSYTGFEGHAGLRSREQEGPNKQIFRIFFLCFRKAYVCTTRSGEHKTPTDGSSILLRHSFGEGDVGMLTVHSRTTSSIALLKMDIPQYEFSLPVSNNKRTSASMNGKARGPISVRSFVKQIMVNSTTTSS